MAALGQEIHARGLKFGLYASPGRKTCAKIYDRYPSDHLGSLGHELGGTPIGGGHEGSREQVGFYGERQSLSDLVNHLEILPCRINPEATGHCCSC